MRATLLAALVALTLSQPSLGQAPKLQTTLVGHKAAINDIAFAPCDNVLASASDDGTVKLWNLATGTNTATFVHPGPVLSVAFDSSGLRVATGCKDGTIRVWNRIAGKNAYTVQADFAARRVWFNRSDNYFWSLFFGETCVGVTYPAKDRPTNGSDYWVMNTGKKDPVVNTCIVPNFDVSAYSRNGTAIANFEPNCQLYADRRTQVADGVILFPPTSPLHCMAIGLRGHQGRVTCLAFTRPDQTWLVSGSADRTIRFWDTYDGKCVASFPAHADAVNCLKFSENGDTLASAGADAKIKLWDVSNVQGR